MKIKLLTTALLLGLSVPSAANACMCDLSDDSQLQEKYLKASRKNCWRETSSSRHALAGSRTQAAPVACTR